MVGVGDKQGRKRKTAWFQKKGGKMEIIKMNNGQENIAIKTVKEIVWLTSNVKKVITRYEYHIIEKN